jgi:hypothetical protein
MFFIDADEFVLPLTHSSIGPVMAAYPPNIAAVSFSWLMYGSSGHEQQPDGQLVIEAFQHHSDPTFDPNLHVKVAVRPCRALNCINAHAFAVAGRSVGSDGHEVEWLAPGITKETPASYGAARINHYFTKSRSQWLAKMARGIYGGVETQRKVGDFELYDRNEIQDVLILRHVAATRAIMTAAGC